ncbi:hypothetical protein K440DRAFT_90266 [Wilcoxina mikolae CBS 423.85]|nr:hypothetical protein K440DRAFT_90266 [Wilcoxina mikolae CBS 423.85]
MAFWRIREWGRLLDFASSSSSSSLRGRIPVALGLMSCPIFFLYFFLRLVCATSMYDLILCVLRVVLLIYLYCTCIITGRGLPPSNFEGTKPAFIHAYSISVCSSSFVSVADQNRDVFTTALGIVSSNMNSL